MEWIIIQHEPPNQKKKKLYALRRLVQGDSETPKGALGNNVRALQPLHHRTVRTNIDFTNSMVKKKLLDLFDLTDHHYSVRSGRFRVWFDDSNVGEHTRRIDFVSLSLFLCHWCTGTRLRHDENGHVVQGQFVEHRHNVIQFDQKPPVVLKKKNLFLHFLQNIVTCFFFCGIERKKSRILLF